MTDTVGDYSDIYHPEQDFDLWYTRATASVIRCFVRPGDRVLELGCATGAMTAEFVEAGGTVVAVDRSAAYLQQARDRELHNVSFVEADLDSYSPDGRFDHVVATNVLHEVQDPVSVMRTAAEHLGPAGLAHVSLQNPYSLHRQVALGMGLIGDLREISARGDAFGTRAIWDVDEVVVMLRNAGLRCLFQRGVVLKPLANEQMQALPRAVLSGFAEVGDRLSEICAMNLFVCSTLKV